MSVDGITFLHFGLVEHSLCGDDWVSASNIAKLTSLVVVCSLWLHDTLRMSGCVDVAGLSHNYASGESTRMWINTDASRT